MELIKSIDGIYVLENGDVFVSAWVPAIIKKEDFGGVEIVSASKFSMPYLGRNGDDKWWIFSPHVLIAYSTRPSTEEISQAEILPSMRLAA